MRKTKEKKTVAINKLINSGDETWRKEFSGLYFFFKLYSKTATSECGKYTQGEVYSRMSLLKGTVGKVEKILYVSH